MRAFFIALLKFSVLALFGPVALLLFFTPSLPFVLAFFALILLVIAVLTLVIFSILGAGKLVKVAQTASLPRSVARSVAESRHYGRRIMQVAQQYPPGPMRDRLNLTLRPVDRWLESLTRLEHGLGKLYSQRNLDRELRQVAFEIDDLRRRSLTAVDGEVRYLRELMQSKKQHQSALKELKSFQTQAELKIHKIASDLATTHAEMLLIVAKGDFNDNRFQRLDENLQEHLAGLRDMLKAMDELGYSSAVS
ncbi:MAG: hypothetical protein HND46_23765 [Chloroflexi bacterium]|nr:hypothetical protein [Chloroflexota bacterium]NOG66439.1 hypothetical protein [Chloroflexota bacterium]GIK42230.1 MAG: hypothetical protein BroJett011_60630 [Chloroflexota bacterium]